MKENKEIRVTEGIPKENSTDSPVSRIERLKKPLIFGLMAIVFVGCMYLIFKPSDNQKDIENIGLNDIVPNPNEVVLLDDKQKAYEQEMLENKDKTSRSMLTSMADYWNEENNVAEEKTVSERRSNAYPGSRNDAVNSYRNAQQTLGSFYEEDNREMLQLQKQVEELKGQLADKETAPTDDFDRQLELMEKSYEIAAKYLPISTTSLSPPEIKEASSMTPSPQSVPSNSTKAPEIQTGVKASVHENQTIMGEAQVRLRLLESFRVGHISIPRGTLLTASSRLMQNRLSLTISSLELKGVIIPVSIHIYDLDGQQGLAVPVSMESNAMREMAANMSQTTGTSIMMTQSAGQQIAGDVSRGVIQGVSGYFSRKARVPKVTLKAGHQVFLVLQK
jgi:hypothetical protein